MIPLHNEFDATEELNRGPPQKARTNSPHTMALWGGSRCGDSNRASLFPAPGPHIERRIADGATLHNSQASNSFFRLRSRRLPPEMNPGCSISVGARNAFWVTRALQCGGYRFAKFMGIPVIIGKLSSVWTPGEWQGAQLFDVRQKHPSGDAKTAVLELIALPQP